uniref:Uncharacterized protein n=1 Tax=Leersia perrieri TaxID=77586 RepID=A0A0D9WUC6_9ORYZ
MYIISRCIITALASPDLHPSIVRNRRRKCDREGCASLSAEQKEARNNKIRENKKRKKENAQDLNQVLQANLQAFYFDLVLWKIVLRAPNQNCRQEQALLRILLITYEDDANLSAHELRRKRARDRYASLSAEQKEARVKKARENRLRKKEESQRMHQYGATNITGDGDIQDIITPQSLAFDDTVN